VLFWIRDGKKIRIWDENSRLFFRELRNIISAKKYLNSFMRIGDPEFFDPGSGMEKFGSGINIPDPQH
jgi:hypothetical protein